MTPSDSAALPSLTADEFRAAVSQRLEKYDRRNLFERFALFMGTAQLLELGLKEVLHHRYAVDPDTMATWTLGRIARELRNRGCRTDFCQLLDSVVECRNHVAHDLLADHALLTHLFNGRDTGRLVTKHLDHAVYEIEQLVVLYDWQSVHDAW